MLIFNNIESQSKADYAVIMLHGHGGNDGSLKPLLNVFSFKKNVSFYFLQAPYLIGEKSYSWSYEIKPGIWERDKPKQLLNDFFNDGIKSLDVSSNVQVWAKWQRKVLIQHGEWPYGPQDPVPWETLSDKILSLPLDTEVVVPQPAVER